MPNLFKHNATGTESDSLFKGDWAINLKEHGGGPTGTTGFYNGVDIPAGGYAIYGPGNHARIANNDTELLFLVGKLGGDNSSVSAALSWANSNNDVLILNGQFSKVIQDGLVFNIDSAIRDSYPTTGTQLFDLSGNNNHAQLINGIGFDSDNYGSLIFDGIDDYLLIQHSETTNIRGSLTASMFSKSLTSNWKPYWNGISKYNQFILGVNNVGEMAFLIYSNGWFPVGYNDSIWGQSGVNTPGEWHMYTGTYDQDSGLLKMYVDGIETASFNVGYRVLNDNPEKFEIGRRECCAHLNLDMALSSAQIYNRALTASEVLQNFEAQKTRFGL